MHAVIVSKRSLQQVTVLGKALKDYIKEELESFIKTHIYTIDMGALLEATFDLDEEEDMLILPEDVVLYSNRILKESYLKYKKAGSLPTIFHTSTNKSGMIKKHQICFAWVKLKDLKAYTSLTEFDMLQHFEVSINSVKRVYTVELISEYAKELEEKIKKRWVKRGIYMMQPDTVVLGPDVYFLGTAVIQGGAYIWGKTICYDSVHIGPNCEIYDSILKENVRVSHSVIEESCIGRDSVIGPFAHIRNHTSIGDGNRIGNFVEVKNSTTGKKTYASHLTYIGDTSCGNGVNFGCGVVTVNYDGKAKHSTWIGDNAFIGCNSNLIAPIRIESNSFIAAGSTIVTSLHQGDFSIARPPQIIKKQYAKKYGYKRVDEE